jgi:hypothetical protein
MDYVMDKSSEEDDSNEVIQAVGLIAMLELELTEEGNLTTNNNDKRVLNKRQLLTRIIGC